MTRSSILVVEDEALIAADLADALEHMGFSVADTVGTAKDAKDSFSRCNPDLVLLDVNLRGAEDGIDVAEMIRAGGTTPIVFLTAQGDDRTLERAEAVEPAGYLIKPFDERTLRATVRMALFRGEAEAARRSQQQMLSAAADRFRRDMLGIDLHGTVRLVNAAAAARGARTGTPLVDALRTMGLAELTAEVLAAVAGDAPSTDGFSVLATDGGYVLLIGQTPVDAELCLCAWCRKARRDDGDWAPLEQVLATAHDIGTTHGICGACAAAHFSSFGED